MTIMENVCDYPAWQANVATATVLKQLDHSCQIIHLTTDTPWPIVNRDVVLKFEKSKTEEGVVVYELTSLPDYLEEKKGFTRIKNAFGKWQFIPKESGEIEITYQFFGDPEGHLPNWVINIFIVRSPYETLRDLKKLIAC